MKKIFLLIIITPLTILGQQTIYDSVFHNNVYREYIVYVPDSYNPNNPVPLIFNLHGLTGTANGQMWYGDFRDIADTANFIIVHPQGLLNQLGQTHWNIGQSTVDDIGFFQLLYNTIISQYNIDSDRVYCTGMSNGGYMSYYLACAMSDKIAAIASVTGAMAQYTQLICTPHHPTPVMEIHGTADLTVFFDDIISGIEYWRNYNNCNLIADTTIIPDIVLNDLSTVEHIVYNNGDNEVTTELFKIIGGGHTWPGSNFPTGITNYDINASVEIWKFFSRYDIYGLIGSTGIIRENNLNKQLIQVIDILGRKTRPIKNTLLFYIYDDGSVNKEIILE